MIPLTREQREYKERTLGQLQANQIQLESQLEEETRPEVIDSLQAQLADIETHISRLRDELAGDIIFDEPLADELFKQATKALAGEKFHLAKKHIGQLETIEPFYPGLDRLKQEADAEKASRRTRSIAAGRATSYPGTALPSEPGYAGPVSGPEPPLPPVELDQGIEARESWFSQFFQFHVFVSCLLVTLILCAMFGVGGVMFLEWLIEGG